MSTETEERVGVSTFTEIVEQMDFHLACESVAHKPNPHRNHAGDAEWLQQGTRVCCGRPMQLMVCTPWRNFVREGMGAIHCVECNGITPTDEWCDAMKFVKL